MKLRFSTGILLFAVALFCHYLIGFSAGTGENFGKYSLAAKLYLAGTLDPRRVTDFSPFYFELHSNLLRWPGSYHVVLLWLQKIAGSLSITILYGIARNYMNSWMAVFVALGFLFTPGFATLTQVFVPDTWFVFFLLLGFLLILRSWNISAALVFGLAFLTRPTALLYVPFALFFLWKFRSLRTALWFLFIFSLFLGGFLFRNYTYTGEFMIGVMDPGGVFFEGNNPYSDGDGVNTPLVKDFEGQYLDQPSYAQVLLKRIPSAVYGIPLNASRANHYWQNKALSFIRENPGAYFRLLLRKIHRLFASEETHDVTYAHTIHERLKEDYPLMFPISVLFIPAAWGVFLKRKCWKEYLFLYTGFLIGLVVPVVYFVSSRYRLPLLPFLMLFSGFAMEYWVDQLKKKKYLFFLVFLSVTLVMAASLDRSEESRNKHSYVWRSIHQAQLLQRTAADLRNAGLRDQARQLIGKALARAPYLYENLLLANLPYKKGEPLVLAIRLLEKECRRNAEASCYFDLGLLLFLNKEYERAANIFEHLVKTGQTYHRWYLCSPYPEVHLARVYMVQGQWDRATGHYARVLNSHPGEPDALAAMSILLERSGKRKEAQSYREKLIRYFDEPDGIFFLGRNYWYAGDYRKSAECFLQVARWLPDYRKAHIFAAASLAREEKIEEAVEEYLRASAIGEEPLLLKEEAVVLFRKYAERDGSVRSRYLYGLILRQVGFFEEAMEIQQTVLKEDPSFTPARSELGALAAVSREKG